MVFKYSAQIIGLGMPENPVAVILAHGRIKSESPRYARR